MPLENTETTESAVLNGKGLWLRGLWMLVFAVLFGVAETVLLIAAVIQFAWMLFVREKNGFLTDFGRDLGGWLNKVSRFQTGESEEKPFPWQKWGA